MRHLSPVLTSLNKEALCSWRLTNRLPTITCNSTGKRINTQNEIFCLTLRTYGRFGHTYFYENPLIWWINFVSCNNYINEDMNLQSGTHMPWSTKKRSARHLAIYTPSICKRFKQLSTIPSIFVYLTKSTKRLRCCCANGNRWLLKY